MEWVRQRAEQERAVSSGARDYWDSFEAACQQAIASFNELFEADPKPQILNVTPSGFGLEAKGEHLNLAFMANKMSIDLDHHTLPIRIDDSGQLYVEFGDRKCDATLLCQTILEPLLFPSSNGRPTLK